MKTIKTNKEKFTAIRCIDKFVPVYHLGFNLKDIPEETVEHGKTSRVLNASYYFKKLIGVPSVETVKNVLIELINEYDKSEEVNSFIIDNNTYWLDKNERASIKNAIEITKAADKTKFVLWVKDTPYEFTVEDAVKIINKLELYAIECYNTTKKHLNTVNDIDNIDDLLKYDFTANYPSKVTV